MTETKTSYSRILKSSSIVGGAEGVNLLLGMVRVKFIAVLLGPVGVGLLGIFQSIQMMAMTLSGLGINYSGVRNVAESARSENEENIARTVLTLRRICWMTGLIGASLLVVLSEVLSHLTFNSGDYAGQISLLGIAVLMSSITLGRVAVLQGTRRIGDLAKLSIITSTAGTVSAIYFYYSMGLAGIVPALITLAAVGLLGSYWFSRRIRLVHVVMTWRESFVAAGSLVRLGVALMWAGLLVIMVEYITRIFIAHELNIVAVGIFTAAFRLSGMLLNFILTAMGADYYPNLSAFSNDHAKMRDLVNQQTEIGLLLAVPGLMVTMSMAPWIIQLFYTAEFSQSANLLQWFVLGCLGRVVSWPMGFVMLAKGASKLFALTQTLANAVHLIAIWVGLKWIGIEGVAIAFCLLYIFYTMIMLITSRHLIGFKWSASVCRLNLILLPVAILTMVQSRYLPIIPATIIGIMMTIFVSIFCLRGLCARLGDGHRLVNKICMIPGMRKILYT